ncbi:tRNA lysidine(34) synthetase TilS [Aurantiacibacter aquimixticola]|nr:tRNA lysidine(34) synthetase TilS [Aurantiacibacter aquimixticola]
MAGSTAIDPDLVERFETALDRLNPDGGKIGLAVSGGPDSMAMLLLAQEAIPGRFEVATVDHGLRPDAKDECALVVAASKKRGVPCEVLAVEVGEGNMQAKAREARYRALGQWVERRHLRAIATAHHANDQMETLLMRLNRGCGTSGLSGIREIHSAGPSHRVIRPLLHFTREELAAIVEDGGIAFARDPSNEDVAFERARLRKVMADIDWFDPKGFAQSAALIETTDAVADLAVGQFLANDEAEIGGDVRNKIPDNRSLRFPVLESQFRAMGKRVRGRDLARLLARLERGENANLAGVLVTIEDGDWVFRPEPPRSN